MLKYIITDEYNTHFYPANLKIATNKVCDFLKNSPAKINIYPDAVVKNNGLPNGLSIVMSFHETILMPFVLRDPGCGYLTFKVNIPQIIDNNTTCQIGKRLNSLINESLLSEQNQQQIFNELSLVDILCEGLNSLEIPEEKASFFKLKFEVDPTAVKLSANDKKLLSSDIMHLTNTLEIRKINSVSQDSTYSLKENDYIGFIHSGCQRFPYLLIDKFLYLICQYADKNKLASLEQIKSGYCGVHLNSDLGQQYFHWLKAAMNYALVSRYLLYLQIKKTLQAEFNIEISLLNDITHAGIFDLQHNQQSYTVSTRGVQPLYNPADKPMPHPFRLIGGQKESIAVLVEGVSADASADNWIQHGASYEIPSLDKLADFFPSATAETYLQATRDSYCNTDLDINLTLPYSFNTVVAQTYQHKMGLIKPLAILTPFINIHGKNLIKETRL